MDDKIIIDPSRRFEDFLGNEWNYNCTGCAISKGYAETPGGVIFEGKYSILGADPKIPIPGFLVLTSKDHINSISELNKEARIEFADVIYYAEKALKELNISKEITLVQEERSSHLHFWIFPTYYWTWYSRIIR